MEAFYRVFLAAKRAKEKYVKEPSHSLLPETAHHLLRSDVEDFRNALRERVQVVVMGSKFAVSLGDQQL